MYKIFINRTLSIFLVFLAMMISMASVSYAASILVKRPLITGENKDKHGVNRPLPLVYSSMLSIVEKDLNIHIELRQYPWNRAVMMASYEGTLILGLSSTPEREEIFNFSQPVVYNFIWLVTRSDKKFDFKTINDLKGKTIGVVRGSKYGGEFDSQKNKTFNTDDDLDSYEIRLNKLMNNRIDAMIYGSTLDDPLEVEKIVNEIVVPNNTQGSAHTKKVTFSVLPVYVFKNDIRFAIRKDKDDGIIEKINGSLEKMKQAKYKIK